MSYCRWSSDFFQCDVYVYADVSGGWTTHVAGRRMRYGPPETVTQMPCDTFDEYWAQHLAYDAWRDSLPKDKDGDVADSEYINLSDIGPEAGESYNDPTAAECAERLEALKASGFNVPQRAIDALRQEAVESPDAAAAD